MRHICKMEKFEISAITKYFWEKGMPPKEINEDFVETLGKKSSSCITVEDGKQSLRWTVWLP